MKVIRLLPDQRVRAIILYFCFQFRFYQPKQNHRAFFFVYNWVVTQYIHQTYTPKATATTPMKSEGTDITILDTDSFLSSSLFLHIMKPGQGIKWSYFPVSSTSLCIRGHTRPRGVGGHFNVWLLTRPLSPLVKPAAGTKAYQKSSSLLLPGRELSNSWTRGRI